ncbi:MAG: Gfo/Idh/MocA family oxidoreductase [Betaproteobacteria bacterium]|nr:Gfo/Idh/MocA family oxidoreductase [Betaproteobacteria bacterium]
MVMRWGIIGLGEIAENNFLPALKKAKDSPLVSVFSRSAEKGKAFCAKHGVPRAYDDLNTMLADRELDAVYIASPNGVHAEQSIAASRAGKHVLVDKPMALTEADGEAMIRAAEQNQVRLDCAYRQRYHTAHIEARKRVQSGVLGEIQLAKAQNFIGGTRPYWPKQPGWRNDPLLSGSGSIVAQAVHSVDLLRYLMDSEITEVHCFTDETPARPAEEISMSLFKFANGALGHVESGAVVRRSDNDTVLYGSAGKISCLNTLGRSEVPRVQEVVVESAAPTIRMPFPDDTWVTRTVPLIEAFNRYITHGEPTLLSAENGLRMIRIANAMQASSRNGRAVKL